MATLSVMAPPRPALPSSDLVFDATADSPNANRAESSGGASGSRTEMRSISTQRSFPDQENLRKLQGHRIWNVRPLPELPVYKTCSEFAGRSELYRGRHSIVWSCFCKQTKHPLVVKMYDKRKMNARHFKNAGREVDILKMLHSTDDKTCGIPAVVPGHAAARALHSLLVTNPCNFRVLTKPFFAQVSGDRGLPRQF
mmetsp:Transcript_5112/g.12919  ORF Transcript_5112/g.12919 Transcript_5112/m.12919 type:complete len:197 (-) Transcript_5112:2031-2621(-)